MNELNLNNPEILDDLDHQVLHMDQGIAYNPEYLATRNMLYYPSRTAQIIRSINNGEISANEYNAGIIFDSLLSGQGERWQNFGESPDDYLLINVLGRKLIRDKGVLSKDKSLSEIASQLEQDNNYEKILDQWNENIDTDDSSDTELLLDDTTFLNCLDSSKALGKFLKENEIKVGPLKPRQTGFNYLANGLIEECKKYVKDYLDELNERKIKRVITLTGQGQYLYQKLLESLGLETDIEFLSILDLINELDIKDAYLYGGSFNTRYLNKANLLNSLSENTIEDPIKNSPEFFEIVNGDKRINKVNIWTPPLAAEFFTTSLLEDSIYEQSLSTIENMPFSHLVICDPYAYKKLSERGYPKEKLVYFLETIK